MEVTDEGIVNDPVKPLQEANAEFPIVVIDKGKDNEVNFLQL